MDFPGVTLAEVDRLVHKAVEEYAQDYEKRLKALKHARWILLAAFCLQLAVNLVEVKTAHNWENIAHGWQTIAKRCCPAR